MRSRGSLVEEEKVRSHLWLHRREDAIGYAHRPTSGNISSILSHDRK
ncbi:MULTISPECIES: hypothetical protein [Cyanophyceae]|nr:hypothetical protein [Trichocoleus sp. FACHB-69]MBD1932093.1 hypothetical protein [Trichocoleus sp. FACHB-69]